MIDRDSSSSGFDKLAALGFNFIDSGPSDVDDLGAGLKGLVWVGDYDNGSCSWQMSDSALAAAVTAHKDDPKVGVWYISDEPDPYACPNAYAQHRARAALVRSIDPDAPVLVVIDSNSGQKSLDQMAGWAVDASTIYGLDAYTCLQGTSTCGYAWIDRLGAMADTLGMTYWAMVQGFGDPDGTGAYMEYLDADGVRHTGQARLPTTDELHEQLVHWRATHMGGYLVFAWSWPSGSPAIWLANQPALLQQLAVENGS